MHTKSIPSLNVRTSFLVGPPLPPVFSASTVTVYTSNGCRPVRTSDSSVVGVDLSAVNSEE